MRVATLKVQGNCVGALVKCILLEIVCLVTEQLEHNDKALPIAESVI